MPWIALTREVPAAIAACELTHLQRAPIDLERARLQHRTYEETLADLGCAVERLPGADELADSVFVEDVAVVLDEVAVITRPGAESRRAETPSVAAVLRAHRPLVALVAPATLDGGDVLRLGRTLWVGLSTRSNAEGARQLAAAAAPHGYRVRTTVVGGCLHLKTAVTELADGVVLLNPAWVDGRKLGVGEAVEVDPAEPFAANVLRLGAEVIVAAAFPRTRERIEARGIATRQVEADELAKAEGGLTCCSLILRVEAVEGPGQSQRRFGTDGEAAARSRQK